MVGVRFAEGRVLPYHKATKIKTELRRAAGIASWPNNALRVGMISYSMALNPDAAALAEAAGHSETMLQTTYKQVHGATPSRAKAWFAVLPETLDLEVGIVPNLRPAETVVPEPGDPPYAPCPTKCLPKVAA